MRIRSGRCPTPSSSPPSARLSAATAAAWPACAPTTSPPSQSRPRSERAGVPAGEIEDVWLGCANQAGEDNRNVARFAALLAGLPETVAGVTVNRLCASGLAAVVGACHAVIAGDGDLVRRRRRRVDEPGAARDTEARSGRTRAAIARSTTRRSAGASSTRGYAELFSTATMGETGDNVAERWSVSREEQDAFALESQRRWAEADAEGRFADELVPVGRARARRASAPGHERREARVAEARVRREGTVTAGNASGHQRRRRRSRRRERRAARAIGNRAARGRSAAPRSRASTRA